MSTKECKLLVALTELAYRGLALVGILAIIITEDAVISGSVIAAAFLLYYTSKHITTRLCLRHKELLRPSPENWFADLPHDVESEYQPAGGQPATRNHAKRS